MKTTLLTLFIFLYCGAVSGQSNDAWTAFWNKDTTLLGYKDPNGIVRVEPKFGGFTWAAKFESIIAASEEVNGKWEGYYLTRSGKITGRDSLYIFDNGADCESEGFIRFRDKKTDKVGMLDRNGNVAIPAAYNGLSNVKNGMVTGLKGARKKYWDKDRHSGCNHFSWVGGTEVLLDTLNNVLVGDFSYDGALNFFSLEKTKQPHPDTIRKSFLAGDGSYYSFVDFEKEFRAWLINELLVGLTKEKLTAASYDTLIWEGPDGWERSARQDFIEKNFDLLKAGLTEILLPASSYFISGDGLNPFMYEGAGFGKYYDNCGQAKEWIYPVMDIVVSHSGKKSFSQNSFEFLRTDKGYKLICITIRNGSVKR